MFSLGALLKRLRFGPAVMAKGTPPKGSKYLHSQIESIHRTQCNDIGTPLRPMHIPYPWPTEDILALKQLAPRQDPGSFLKIWVAAQPGIPERGLFGWSPLPVNREKLGTCELLPAWAQRMD